MLRNPKRGGTAASQSFRADEVAVGLKIFETLARGGDASTIVRSEPGRRLWKKLVKMKASIEAARKNG